MDRIRFWELIEDMAELHGEDSAQFRAQLDLRVVALKEPDRQAFCDHALTLAAQLDADALYRACAESERYGDVNGSDDSWMDLRHSVVANGKALYEAFAADPANTELRVRGEGLLPLVHEVSAADRAAAQSLMVVVDENRFEEMVDVLHEHLLVGPARLLPFVGQWLERNWRPTLVGDGPPIPERGQAFYELLHGGPELGPGRGKAVRKMVRARNKLRGDAEVTAAVLPLAAGGDPAWLEVLWEVGGPACWRLLRLELARRVAEAPTAEDRSELIDHRLRALSRLGAPLGELDEMRRIALALSSSDAAEVDLLVGAEGLPDGLPVEFAPAHTVALEPRVWLLRSVLRQRHMYCTDWAAETWDTMCRLAVHRLAACQHRPADRDAIASCLERPEVAPSAALALGACGDARGRVQLEAIAIEPPTGRAEQLQFARALAALGARSGVTELGPAWDPLLEPATRAALAAALSDGASDGADRAAHLKRAQAALPPLVEGAQLQVAYFEEQLIGFQGMRTRLVELECVLEVLGDRVQAEGLRAGLREPVTALDPDELRAALSEL